jgi:hypothetical protein
MIAICVFNDEPAQNKEQVNGQAARYLLGQSEHHRNVNNHDRQCRDASQRI